MKVNKRKISEWFLPNLYRISNKEYQKRIWIKGAGPECQDFDEAVNDFFGEGDHILENYQDYGLSNIQYQILKKFRDEFNVFVEGNDFPEEFIDTPEWAKIMGSAKDVLKAFNYQSENKKQTLQSFVEAIEGVSNKKHQERVWALGEESEYDDLIETICHFFEKKDGILEKYKDYGINDKQYELLIKFRDQFYKFVKGPRPYLSQEFTERSEWEKITEMAKEILKAFNYKKNRK